MSTNQVTAPLCGSGHGLKVPTDTQFCLADESGLVQLVVLWDMVDGEMVQSVYAPDDCDASALLPDLSRDTLGEQIQMLRDSGRLTIAYELYEQLTGCYRLDIKRPGHDHTYMIWLADERRDGLSLRPNVIYRFFNSAKPSEGEPITDVSELLNLLSTSTTMTDATGMTSEGLSRMKAERQVITWDIGAVQRNLNAESGV